MTIGTNCSWADNGSVTGILKLEAFDTVYIRKWMEQIAGGPYWNTFMIESLLKKLTAASKSLDNLRQSFRKAILTIGSKEIKSVMHL